MAKLLSCVLGLALAISAIAADTKPTTANKGPKRYPYHANVAAVDLSAKTITLDGKKKQRVLNVTPTTRILKDKNPVALDTIKVGEYVTGSLVDTDGRLEPTTVNVGGTKTKQLAQAPASAPTQSANATQQKSSTGVVKPNPGSPKKIQ
jgi:archaellin